MKKLYGRARTSGSGAGASAARCIVNYVTDQSGEGVIPPGRLQRILSRYPPAENITPNEFEAFVSEVLAASATHVDGLVVDSHVVLSGVDGDFDLDAMATFEIAGMTFKVVIEAKRHKDPIKRELVQVLHSKMVSVGAQKALLVASGRFQSGAIGYALIHGIALATLSEGRLTFETRSEDPPRSMSREQARQLGLENHAAMVTVRIDGSTRGFRLSPSHVDSFVNWVISSGEEPLQPAQPR